MIRVTVWNEFWHEQNDPAAKALYPDGIHKCIADFLQCDDIEVRTATLWEPECGLTQEVLDNTDVLIWWAHLKHKLVPDEVVDRVQNAVLCGMGMIFLHSGHFSKPFRRLMGTSGTLSWRDCEQERLWNIAPSHPITQGIGRFIEIEDEVYAEPFDIPEPDQLIFIGTYAGSEVFRSGCCYRRGLGNIFYFQPGHETCPVFHNPDIQTVIRNAVRWAAPQKRVSKIDNIKIERI